VAVAGESLLENGEAMATNLEILKNACIKLLGYDDLWIIGGLTDYSFEEGEHNSYIKQVLKSYDEAKMLDPPLSWLRDGINGNLKKLIEHDHPSLIVDRNQGAGQDLNWPCPFPEAKVEVKQVFDCTYPKYYTSVARDFLEKLPEVRRRGFLGDLFSVAFFLQFPEYKYPRGNRYGNRKVVFRGIMDQFAQLAALGDPVWRSEPRKLVLPRKEVGEAIARRFQTAFEQPEHWRFDLVAALKDAAVAVSIWQCR
jgi:hypothetical protein